MRWWPPTGGDSGSDGQILLGCFLEVAIILGFFIGLPVAIAWVIFKFWFKY